MKLVAALGAAFVAYLLVMALALGSVMGGSASGSVVGGSFSAGAHPAGLGAEAMRNVEISLRVAERERAPELAVRAELVAGLGESGFIPTVNSLGYGGVFQGAVATSGVNYFNNDDTEAEAHYFLLGGKGFQAGGAIHLAAQPSLTPGAIATLVEASGKPASYYDAHDSQAEQILAAWRSGEALGTAGAGGAAGPVGSDWLATVPGTSLQCDRRIVGDVVAIVERWRVSLTACYAPTGHEAGGEHPLGLAVDLVPAPPTTWANVGALARWAGWRPACASTGCAGQTGTVFRFVGWDGYAGHGDPAHAGANAHLHLSWSWRGDRGPPAESVQTLSG